jgi:hypothetical protein
VFEILLQDLPRLNAAGALREWDMMHQRHQRGGWRRGKVKPRRWTSSKLSRRILSTDLPRFGGAFLLAS